jgi:hypothetical protein
MSLSKDKSNVTFKEILTYQILQGKRNIFAILRKDYFIFLK